MFGCIGRRDGSTNTFGNKKEKPGFAQEIKSALSEMYQYGVKGEDIKELAKQLENKPMLALKMEDLGSIYNKFEEFIIDRAIKILDGIERCTGKKITDRNSEDVVNYFGTSLEKKEENNY